MLRCVAHVSRFSYHLFSLRTASDKGHQYKGTREGVTMKITTGGKVFFPSVGRLNVLYAYHPNALVDETANPTFAPGVAPTAQTDPVNINDFLVAHAHAHEGALRKTAKQVGVTLVGNDMNARGSYWPREPGCQFRRRGAQIGTLYIKNVCLRFLGNYIMN